MMPPLPTTTWSQSYVSVADKDEGKHHIAMLTADLQFSFVVMLQCVRFL